MSSAERLRERVRQAVLAVEPKANDPYPSYVWAGDLTDAVLAALTHHITEEMDEVGIPGLGYSDTMAVRSTLRHFGLFTPEPGT